MPFEFDEFTDMIDSRDIVARQHELQDRDDASDEDKDLFPALPLTAEEKEELDDLLGLLVDLAANSNDRPEDGITMIRDTYFERYAEEFANDIGAINPDAAWPVTHIDWEAAARDLQQDYALIQWRGVDYWVR